jgi:hypothetical protein
VLVVNAKRIVLGGLLAALIIVAVETLIFAVLLAEPMATARNARGLEEASWGGKLYIATTIVLGIMLAWLYAAIRPRFGPGPITAVRAGGFLWVATWLIYYLWLSPTGRGLLFLQPRHTAVALTGELAGVLLGALAAGWVYRERERV